MNERIQQLEKQCWETKQLTNDAHSWHISFNTQKFAELIVRECVDIASKYDESKMSGPGLMIGHMIEQHFGVLE